MSALRGGDRKREVPEALSPEIDSVPVHGKLGGPKGQSGGICEISSPPGFDLRTFQPVASRYTDWAISVTQ
jgi:hypothetical protein